MQDGSPGHVPFAGDPNDGLLHTLHVLLALCRCICPLYMCGAYGIGYSRHHKVTAAIKDAVPRSVITMLSYQHAVCQEAHELEERAKLPPPVHEELQPPPGMRKYGRPPQPGAPGAVIMAPQQSLAFTRNQ